MKALMRFSATLLAAWTGMLILNDASASTRAFRVVIDPGHGGPDEGTVYDNGKGDRVAEKDITLMLARETARQLRARGIQVFLTRQGDKELPLSDRTAIANRLKADVFLSIHMNSTASHPEDDGDGTAAGFESYILNNTTDASSRRLAHFENSVLKGSATDAVADQLDVALILKDLRLDANLGESKKLACGIQNQLSRKLSARRDRGVKQSLFYVLLGADMPSVLIEVGFLSNPQDRALVLSYKGQKAISGSIAAAVSEYRKLRSSPLARASLSRCKVN